MTTSIACGTAERAHAALDGYAAWTAFLRDTPEIWPYLGAHGNLTTYYPVRGTDDEMRAEIDKIALIIGARAAVREAGGNYACRIHFGGGVTYEAVAVLRRLTPDEAASAAVSARLAGWIDEQGIPYPDSAQKLAARVLENIHHTRVAKLLDDSDHTGWLRDACDAYADPRQPTDEEWVAEEWHHGHGREDRLRWASFEVPQPRGGRAAA